MSEPKKVDRRKFIYAGLGAVALIAIGAAAYVAMNPPVVTQTVTTSTTVPTTSVVTTTVPTTSVVTTTIPTTSVVTTTTTAPSGKKVLRWLTTETATASMEVFKKWINEYTTTHPDVEIQLEATSWDEIYTKILSAVAAGTGYELLHAVNYNVVMLAKMDLLLPVDEIIKLNTGPGRTPDEDYFPYTRVVINGHDYMVPYRTGPQFIWYRKDLFTKYNLSIPSTYDELLNCAKTLNGKDGVYGYGLPLGRGGLTQELFTNFVMGNGCKFYVDWVDGRWDTTLDKSPWREKVKETLLFYKELMKYAPPDCGTYSYNEVINSYVYGKVAMANYAGRLLVNLENTNPDLGSKTSAFGFPVGPGWKDDPLGIIKTYDTMGGLRFGPQPIFSYGWCVMKNSKYPYEALDFIAYCSRHEKNLELWNTVPLHEMPAIKSQREVGWYLENPILKKHPDVLKFSDEYEAKGSYTWFAPRGPNGPLFPAVGQLFGTLIITDMVQAVCLKNTNPDQAIDEAATKIKELLKQT
jgi:ABC-type glycerol-3-phosphate transport system substrate-binding protein